MKTALEIKRAIAHTTWGCKQFPGLIFTFYPTGVLFIKGSSNPLKYSYTITHTAGDEDCIFSTSPHILNEPSTMIIKMINNHITLISTKGNGETLHLERLQHKLD